MLNWGAQKPPSGTLPNFSHPLMRGILGQWIFNEDTGLYAYDSSGYNNNGLLIGMSFPPIITSGWGTRGGRSGLVFDNTNDYLDCGANNKLAGKSFSIVAWALRTALASADPIVSQGSTGDNKWLHFQYSSDNTFRFGFYNNDLDTVAAYTDITNWHHWVGTYDHLTNLRTIYRDGAVVAQDTATNDFMPTSFNIYIGKFGTSWFRGLIGDVRIYNRALMPDEVMILFLSPYCMFPKQNAALLYQAPAAGITANSLMFGINF